VSYGEPIALRGQVELEQVAETTIVDSRLTGDARLIERLRSGDTVAFDELINERSGEVYALLFRLTEDAEEARDLAQETFLRAFQSISKFRGDADIRTWLYRIAINQARNRWRWWRRRKRDLTFSIDIETEDGKESYAARLSAGDSGNPELQAIAREREVTLRRALHSIRATYREAVVLRDIEGLTYEEIAIALDIGVGTVKSRLARGRDELRKKLGSSF
jgi:RNA polymerase sigma-70 factor, ECF subfamily